MLNAVRASLARLSESDRLPPTVREIAGEARLPSSTVHAYLQRLVDRGEVAPPRGKARAWLFTKKASTG